MMSGGGAFWRDEPMEAEVVLRHEKKGETQVFVLVIFALNL